jgi:8-oxo-dGTP pyrophosphatase MutT (NUDIX family)
MPEIDLLTPAQITACLSSRKAPPPPWGLLTEINNLRPASVLVPFIRQNNSWHLLFTRRTDDVQNHKGQVSFPGGAIENEDHNEIIAALREAQEEIGLQPQDVSILGQLDPVATLSGYLITPVVAIIPANYTFTPSPQEVSRIFTMPLAWLAKADHYNESIRTFPNGITTPVFYYDLFDGELLWGITAYITVALIDVIKNL